MYVNYKTCDAIRAYYTMNSSRTVRYCIERSDNMQCHTSFTMVQFYCTYHLTGGDKQLIRSVVSPLCFTVCLGITGKIFWVWYILVITLPHKRKIRLDLEMNPSLLLEELFHNSPAACLHIVHSIYFSFLFLSQKQGVAQPQCCSLGAMLLKQHTCALRLQQYVEQGTLPCYIYMGTFSSTEQSIC